MPSRITQRIDQVSTGDITAVTAGVAINGGGTSGAVVINVTVADDDLVIASQIYS
tara:strand:- start:65 stop:229 length:165 start_codon:yes stop_codon:yes gene_type:complete